MNYTAERQTADGIEVVYLADTATKTEVRIVPSIGNNSYEMTVAGQPVFWSPYRTLSEFKAKPVNLGNPFLAPWANRLDQEAFFANKKRYALNMGLGNVRKDGFQQPIHGLLLYSPYWQIASLTGGGDAAAVTCRLEFWRYPDYMAQFPFAHAYEMTYRLRDGVLEIETVVENLSTDTMPVSVAYHPYFTLPGVPRDQWAVTVPCREHVQLNAKLTPTGERQPYSQPEPVKLAGRQFDDVFAGVDSSKEFVVEGGGKRIGVRFGPKYPVGVVYAPPGRDFICFEPMSGITNAFNLHHEGKYPELQSIVAGGRWRESYWIHPQYGR